MTKREYLANRQWWFESRNGVWLVWYFLDCVEDGSDSLWYYSHPGAPFVTDTHYVVTIKDPA